MIAFFGSSRLVFFSILGLFLVTSVALADSGVAESRGRSCAPVVGTYLVDIVDAEGSFSSRSTISLYEDGNLSAVDSSQGGVPGVFSPFTAQQGDWRCTGRYSLNATGVNFNFAAEGFEAGIARADYEASIRRKGRHIEGTIRLRFFALDGDPLHPDPADEGLLFSFAGERIVAH